MAAEHREPQTDSPKAPTTQSTHNQHTLQIAEHGGEDAKTVADRVVSRRSGSRREEEPATSDRVRSVRLRGP